MVIQSYWFSVTLIKIVEHWLKLLYNSVARTIWFYFPAILIHIHSDRLVVAAVQLFDSVDFVAASVFHTEAVSGVHLVAVVGAAAVVAAVVAADVAVAIVVVVVVVIVAVVAVVAGVAGKAKPVVSD